MCGRFLLTTPAEALAELLGLDEAPDIVVRFNIAPTQMVGIVRASGSGARREWVSARWGLVPAHSSEPTTRAPLFNARAETLPELPAFRAAFRQRRCLVPASGFYEWKAEGKRRQAHLFRLRGEAPFAFAGLWERWQRGTEPALESCAIVTTEPNDLVREVHDRMPVILPRDAYASWLDPKAQDPRALARWLRPFPPSEMERHRVGPRVNSARIDDPLCAEPEEDSASVPRASGPPH
jgi:putative SOS response-associated peptidase YedK